MTTWHSDRPPPERRIAPSAWPRVLWRGGAIFTLLAAGAALSMVLRPVERAIHGPGRPASGWITTWICRAAIAVLGIERHVEGQAATGPGGIVANHSSWLDILVLNATGPLVFVAKAEVSGWPGIGGLARITGTLFVRRDRRAVRAEDVVLRARLAEGRRLLFFPEGTSTDGRRVLTFKSPLFAPFVAREPGSPGRVQPVSVIYAAPAGRDPRFYGWWGDMDLAPHALGILAERVQGQVRVVLHPDLDGSAFGDRKALARAAELRVRAGVMQRLERADQGREPV